MSDDYVKTAWSKGLSAPLVLFRHVLRNALIPVITTGSLSIAGLLNGAVIVEWIFAWPGVGKLGIDAIYARDFTMIQGFVLLTAVIYVDHQLPDRPRLRRARSQGAGLMRRDHG